ncbi:MAG TPA: 50S ribosomal protein L32 [Patescibacteria group bacterium]|nr:50S ribosomal protein L32 [Patescibacteria group bacterium]
MAHEPKKRHSRQRQGKRRASIALKTVTTVRCENCGEQHLPHLVCPHCGFYRGSEIVAKTKSTAKTV